MTPSPFKWPEITAERPFRVLFVCLGNICRSPTAEGIFIDLVKRRGLERFFEIDSAGLGPWHAGEPAHATSQAVANRRGVHLPSIGRQVQAGDFSRFDLILAMDRDNYAGLMERAPDDRGRERVRMFRDWDPAAPGAAVPDPYYGGLDGFEAVFDLCLTSATRLLDDAAAHIRK